MRYTIRAAALATGISDDRLRTWERRYGVPAPSRTDTGRRRYDEADLAVIRRMAVLVDGGLSAVAAAATVRAEGITDRFVPPGAPFEVDARASELVDRSCAFDERALLDLLGAVERAEGVEAAIERVALPALVEAGQRWERSDLSPAGEHMLSEAIRSWLSGLARSLPVAPASVPFVLVACPEDECHDLGALALAVLLRRQGLRVAYLGANVPTSALVDASRAAAFDALCLSITSAASLPVARLALTALLAADIDMPLYVGGPALREARDGGTDVFNAVRLPASVVAAAHHVAAQVRA